jgi:hypothetical protein
MIWLLSALTLMTASSPAHAQTANDTAEIQKLITAESNLSDFDARLNLMTEAFVGRPYLKNGPLGEGLQGVYDQDPLYRTDGFDCTTYVETTISLARSLQTDDFLNQLNHIRYKDGVVDFTLRNHFVEIDWNPNNEAAGILKDITRDLAKKPGQLSESIQTISKRNWYQKMTVSNLQLVQATPDVLAERLNQLRNEGARFEDQVSTLPFLKMNSLNETLPMINSSAVLNLLRDFKEADGRITSYVSHQVLLVWKNGKARVRQASSKSSNMKVIDQSLSEFITAQQAGETTGINVLQVLKP